MAVDLTTFTASTKSAASLSFQIDIPEASGTRVYAFCHAGIATANTTAFDIVGATLDGAPMTLLHNETLTSTNRRYREHLYELVDPLGGGMNPTTQTFEVTYNRGLSTMGVTIIVATGVVDRGDPVGDWEGVGTSAISLNVTPAAFPGAIIAGGHTQNRTSGGDSNFDDLTDTGDVTATLTKVATGNTDLVDLVVWSGYATADVLDTYALGWSWPVGASAILIALPLYGTAEYAEAEFSGDDPEVVYGTATLDGIRGEAEFSGFDPEVVLGSIPPVQVIGRGSLYLSTAARNISVLLLATTGEFWTVADAADAVEDLGLIVSRRKGYLTPM